MKFTKFASENNLHEACGQFILMPYKKVADITSVQMYQQENESQSNSSDLSRVLCVLGILLQDFMY